MCYKNLPNVKTFSSDILKIEMERFTVIHAKAFSCLKIWLQNEWFVFNMYSFSHVIYINNLTCIQVSCVNCETLESLNILQF